MNLSIFKKISLIDISVPTWTPSPPSIVDEYELLGTLYSQPIACSEVFRVKARDGTIQAHKKVIKSRLMSEQMI